MNAVFVTVLCFLSFVEDVTGVFHAIFPTQPIVAEEGDEVTLHCHLDPPIDLTGYTLDWARVDLDEIMYFYRDKQHHYDAQMKRYRNRTTFNLDGLTRGDVTLRISSVQLDDSGPYRCFVLQLNVSCDFNIIVVPKGQLNRSKTGGDVSTSRPPVTHVTKTNIKDGENKATIAMYVCLPLVAVLCIIVGVVALYFRREIIRMIEKMRGKEEAKQEDEENNPEETKELKESGV